MIGKIVVFFYINKLNYDAFNSYLIIFIRICYVIFVNKNSFTSNILFKK